MRAGFSQAYAPTICSYALFARLLSIFCRLLHPAPYAPMPLSLGSYAIFASLLRHCLYAPMPVFEGVRVHAGFW
eukprot:2652452-Rhodomonas_salina.1